MKASEFERRHAMVLRLCVYAAAFSAYFFDRDDVVWRFIRELPSRRSLEHFAFLIATLMIAAGAWLSTRADAYAADTYAGPTGLRGDWLYAIGLSTLAPLAGCVVLMSGESLRILRLAVRARQGVADDIRNPTDPRWGYAVRRQAAKWGVLVTMVVFTITLMDRVADYGIVASVAVWAVLNWSRFFGGGS